MTDPKATRRIRQGKAARDNKTEGEQGESTRKPRNDRPPPKPQRRKR